MKRLWPLVVVLVLVEVKQWLISGQTVAAIGNAIHDDRLFLTLADHFAHGRWLGPYSDMTLCKGPFYPMFIGAVSWVGLPLLKVQQLVYACACLLVVAALRPLRLPRGVVLAGFALLLFQPMSASSALQRTIRDHLYTSLSLIVAALVLALIVRRGRPPRALLPWAAALGVAFAAFWLTREEGLWLVCLPAALALAARDSLRRLLVMLGLPLGVAAALVGTVAAVNWSHYGLAVTVEYRQADFLAAYGAIARVEHQAFRREVTVPREVWRRLYAASPAFDELRPYLEGEGLGWGDPTLGGEIRGGWFMWALRAGAAQAGHHTSADEAAAFYRRLAAEVNRACDEGRLACGPSRATMMPPWHEEYLRPAAQAFLHGVRSLATFDLFSAASPPSYGNKDELVLFREMTGQRLAPVATNERRWRIAGSARHTDAAIAAVNAFCRGAEVFVRGKLESGDELLVTCNELPEIELVTGRARERFRAVSGCAERAGFTFCVDRMSSTLDDGRPRDGGGVRGAALTAVGRAYQLGFPFLFGGALVALGWRLFRRSRTGLTLVALALAGSVAARLGLLALIEATSFPAIFPPYMAPGYAVAVLLVVVAGCDLSRADPATSPADGRPGRPG